MQDDSLSKDFEGFSTILITNITSIMHITNITSIANVTNATHITIITNITNITNIPAVWGLALGSLFFLGAGVSENFDRSWEASGVIFSSSR